MKLKAIIGCILVAAMLTLATPALALSIGVSPTHVELEVPGDGSATVSVNIHYFSGDVNISLVDIPLRIEPSTIHVDASEEPVAIELTIYGEHALDTQVYDGYIRFIAVSGGAATGGVQVIAKITNIADGIAPPEEPVVEESVVEQQEESLPDTAQPEPETAATAASSPPQSPPQSPPSQGLPTTYVIAASVGGTLLIVLAFVGVRRLLWRD